MAKDNPASFYAQLVGLDTTVPSFRGQGPSPSPQPQLKQWPPPNTHAGSTRSSKPPPTFRSAGVVDLSDPNDVGHKRAAQQQQQQGAMHSSATLQGSQTHSHAAPSHSQPSSSAAQGETGPSPVHCQSAQRASGAFGSSSGQETQFSSIQHHDRPCVDPGGGAGSGGGSDQGYGGVLVLGPAQARKAASQRRLASGEAQLAAHLDAARARTKPAAAVQLPPDSVGFKLLKASGWKPGAGLGSQEQGIAAPLEASRNPGQRGIGFDKKRSAHDAHLEVNRQPKQLQGAAKEAAEVGQKRSAMIAGIVQNELAEENTEAKLAHHRAAQNAAHEAAQHRAMQRALFAAFNDPFDNAGYATANANPLGRNRLTATNPLLDSDDEKNL